MTQMSTVWLTVLVSGERYVAICKPLKSSSIITMSKVSLPTLYEIKHKLDTQIQTSNLKSFHPKILKISNHILRNCKNANIATFLYSRIWNFSTVVTKINFPGGNFLNLHTVIAIKLHELVSGVRIHFTSHFSGWGNVIGPVCLSGFTQATLYTTTTVYGVLVHREGAICTIKA